jgi:hypothetical protein
MTVLEDQEDIYVGRTKSLVMIEWQDARRERACLCFDSKGNPTSNTMKVRDVLHALPRDEPQRNLFVHGVGLAANRLFK